MLRVEPLLKDFTAHHKKNLGMKLAHVAAIVFAFLTACGPTAVPRAPFAGLRSTSAIRHDSGSGYAIVYTFGGSNGSTPLGTLLFYNNALYGTTYAGGSTNNGTVFVVKTGGNGRVLHSFGNTGGSAPEAGLTLLNGVLYGTTSSGGKYGRGTVFSITPSGHEKLLHSFSSNEGKLPRDDLVVLNGTLYGTTLQGGRHNAGTVFSITQSGAVHVLHSFPNSATDGIEPSGGLVAVRGTLYGATIQGGSCGSQGFGTVFAITTGGKERVVYSFGCTPGDGTLPEAGLIAVKNVLYGTTFYGGSHSTYRGGAAFSVTLAGIEKVLFSFGAQSAGINPNTALTAINGTFFGCTYDGGTYNLGTVYSVDASGYERVLHSFGSSFDGANPSSTLLNVRGTLYGTTAAGGGANVGTIFKISP